VLDDNWLTSPMKDRNSDHLVGVGNCVMAFVIDVSS